ncbi:MAG: hypothetical protein LBC76_08315 [Treponema sp.]|nr:hypothetical protein [Treponema sp.]
MNEITTKVFKYDEAVVILYKGGDYDVCTKNGIEYCADINEFRRWYPELAKVVEEEL